MGESIEDLLGPELFVKDADGQPRATSTSTFLQGKYTGLLFTRRWTPQCHRFLPKLISAFDLLKAEKPFEIVFVHCEATQEAFDDYYAEMPFATLGFGSPQIAALQTKFDTSVMPVLVILSPEGRVVSSNAKVAIINKPEGFPWEGMELRPKVLLSLTARIQQIFPYLLPLLTWFVYYWWRG